MKEKPLARRRLSRRAVIGGALGTAGALALGGIGIARVDDADVMRSTLQRLVGDFRMDAAAFATFVTDFKDEFGRYGGPQALFFRVGEFSGGLPYFSDVAPNAVGGKIESFERALVTNFLFTTDYLQLADPAAEAVSYNGPLSACINPFARFD